MKISIGEEEPPQPSGIYQRDYRFVHQKMFAVRLINNIYIIICYVWNVNEQYTEFIVIINNNIIGIAKTYDQWKKKWACSLKNCLDWTLFIFIKCNTFNNVFS